MYNIKSRQAEEFINHQEILDTLEYAQANRNNRPLIESLIDKAALCQGLSHREAALLLECDEPGLVERIFHLAREIKQKFYGNRIVMLPFLSFQLLRERLRLLPVSCQEPYHPRKKLARGDTPRDYRLGTWGINAWRAGSQKKTLETTLSTIS